MQMKSLIIGHWYILVQFKDNFPLLYNSFKISVLLKWKNCKKVNLQCSSWNGMIFWCHNCNSSPPVNNLVPSKFHDKEVIFDSVCRLPVWTHLYSNCYKRKDLVRIFKYVLKYIFKNLKRREVSIQTCEQVLWISGVGSKIQTWFS